MACSHCKATVPGAAKFCPLCGRALADQVSGIRDGQDISYHLLSDFDSAVVKKFGILNTLIQPKARPAPSPSLRGRGLDIPSSEDSTRTGNA